MYDFECLTDDALVADDLNDCSPDDEPCYPFARCYPEHDCNPW